MTKTPVIAGRATPLDRSDIDTDTILPTAWLKRTSRTGYADGLFSAWRQDPGFILNDPDRAGSKILITGPNFGIGSSREHAVWALLDFGFRAVVSSRLGDIFRSNCIKAGLVPVVVGPGLGEDLLRMSLASATTVVRIDLADGRISIGDPPVDGPFEVDGAMRTRFIDGMDDIDCSLLSEAAIEAHEQTRPTWLTDTRQVATQ